jgi:hypothetical protein
MADIQEYKEISSSLSSFVEKMAFSVAEAKKRIDQASIEMLQELSKQTLEIPVVRQIAKPLKDNSGNIISHNFETTVETLTVSPLTLGIRPTFYEFQKTEIEVSLDLEIGETQTLNSESETKLFVNTKKVRTERKYQTNLTAFSKLRIEMVPVPPPNNLPEFIQTITE